MAERINPLQVLEREDNPLSNSPTTADAWEWAVRAYRDWAAKQLAEGVRQGLNDPQTGWPTEKGYKEAATQFANALLAGSTGPRSLRAFHGSPHSFEKFSLDAIGTGEGKQAFGHGLYFAENEAVARGYRDKLSMLRAKPNGQHDPGHMYEVEIKAPPERLLDWDKPLGEQSPHVKDVGEKLGLPTGATGEDVLLAARNGPPDHIIEGVPGWSGSKWLEGENHVLPAEVAKKLQDAGIPGIRYLDGGSRKSGDGSHNVVVFDSSLIEIIRKYGWAGLLAGGANALTAEEK